MAQVTKRAKAHRTYALADGTIVPGVTTVLQVLNKPALVRWANRLGLAGIDSTKYVDDKAAIGELAHQMIADYLRGEKTDTSEYSKVQIDQAENALLSFFEWEKSNQIEPIFIEEPIVSETWKFGGTVDCFGKVNNKLTLLDFKTSASIFPEMKIQVAAYCILLAETQYCHPEDVTILRIGRTPDEGFEVHPVNHLHKRKELFCHCLAIYHLQKELK